MNSFANSILSFLLSWIRALAANLWSMVNSEDGGALYRFLASYWLWILLALCVGGWIVDRVIYFIRWRPHYVWLSRLDRMRRKRGVSAGEPPVQPEPRQAEPFDAAPVYTPADRQPPYAADAYADAPYQPEPAQPLHTFAPTAQYSPQYAADTRLYEPPSSGWQAEEEPLVRWDEADPVFEAPAADPEPAAPQSSMAYYRDMQSGFAPAVSPERLYAAPRSAAPETAPVHPGLNEDIFRQNIGLEVQGEVPDLRAPVVQAPVFRPFTAVQPEPEPARTPSALSRFAKRARDLVGIADEENAPSIRDLQSTVDVASAFHEPVYPQQSSDSNDLSF